MDFSEWTVAPRNYALERNKARLPTRGASDDHPLLPQSLRPPKEAPPPAPGVASPAAAAGKAATVAAATSASVSVADDPLAPAAGGRTRVVLDDDPLMMMMNAAPAASAISFDPLSAGLTSKPPPLAPSASEKAAAERTVEKALAAEPLAWDGQKKAILREFTVAGNIKVTSPNPGSRQRPNSPARDSAHVLLHGRTRMG